MRRIFDGLDFLISGLEECNFTNRYLMLRYKSSNQDTLVREAISRMMAMLKCWTTMKVLVGVLVTSENAILSFLYGILGN